MMHIVLFEFHWVQNKMRSFQDDSKNIWFIQLKVKSKIRTDKNWLQFHRLVCLTYVYICLTTFTSIMQQHSQANVEPMKTSLKISFLHLNVILFAYCIWGWSLTWCICTFSILIVVCSSLIVIFIYLLVFLIEYNLNFRKKLVPKLKVYWE